MPPHGRTRARVLPDSGTMLQADDTELDVAAAIVAMRASLASAAAALDQVVTNTGGEDPVNLETILQGVEAACVAILGVNTENKDYNAASKTNLDSLVSIQIAARDALLAIQTSSAAAATDLAAIEVINTAIQVAVETIDNYVGTHDAVAPAGLAIIGGVAETTVPAAVADGDAVRINYDEYGRHRDAGHDPAVSAESVADVAPAVMQVGEFSFTQLTAPGSTPATNVQDYRNHTFQILLDLGSCTDVTVRADGSLDGTNWAPLGVVDDDCVVTGCAVANEVLTITVNGTYYLRLQNLKTKYIRFTFIAEAGDTDATLNVDLTSGI